MKRVIIIVLDSLGIGEAPDAKEYGDEGSDTLRHIVEGIENFRLPNLERLGLAYIDGIDYFPRDIVPIGSYAKMRERSAGKDTTTGHWEITGLILNKPFPVYPNGFPKDIIRKFERMIGTRILGNKPASGTVIIEELGIKHMETGYPIVYTSADSVFQIAAHEEVISVERLYEMCGIARQILRGEHGVGRVIARPFIGEPGNFVRTDRRRDFSLDPIGETMLDYIKESNMDVKGVGKIVDIFNGNGLTDFIHTHNNMDGVDRTLDYMREPFEGIIFTNLVDFDMKYGHRNDIRGYGRALIDFDARLPEIMDAMYTDDILMITADHGCDPKTESTDHSREYTPLLIYGKLVKENINLGIRNTFADIAATVLEYLGVQGETAGKSFLGTLLHQKHSFD